MELLIKHVLIVSSLGTACDMCLPDKWETPKQKYNLTFFSSFPSESVFTLLTFIHFNQNDVTELRLHIGNGHNNNVSQRLFLSQI